ncbi:uncharacterized protein LOC144155377 [Haemaphysalis longicornis]
MTPGAHVSSVSASATLSDAVAPREMFHLAVTPMKMGNRSAVERGAGASMALSAAASEQSSWADGERGQGDSRPAGTKREECASQRQTLFELAKEDPGLLTPLETELLARGLFFKVTEHIWTAKFAADFCVSAMAKQGGRVFADALLAYISDRQSELLPRRRFPPAWFHPEGQAGEEPRHKWACFVHFLSHLLAAMADAGWLSPGHNSLWRLFAVARVLWECWELMLRRPAQDVLDEVKCLQASLLVAGKAVDLALEQQVNDVVVLMRGASKSAQYPPEAQKILLELIDLRESQWER